MVSRAFRLESASPVAVRDYKEYVYQMRTEKERT